MESDCQSAQTQHFCFSNSTANCCNMPDNPNVSGKKAMCLQNRRKSSYFFVILNHSLGGVNN